MEQLIRNVLEMNPFVVFFVLMLLAFVPGSCIILNKKINRWVKTVTVLVCGELSAIAIFVLAQAAKTAGTGSILAEFTPTAVILAVLILGGAIVGHVTYWDQKILRKRT